MNAMSATLLVCGGDVASLAPELVINTLVQDAFMVPRARWAVVEPVLAGIDDGAPAEAEGR